MDQATPDWRTFSAPPDEPGPVADEPPRRRQDVSRRWLGLAAALAGIAVVSVVLIVTAVAALLMDAAPAAGPAGRQAAGQGSGLLLDTGSPSDSSPMALDGTGAGIVVDVAGAVAQPGLHRLQAGDRVGDAIEVAGGFAPRVDLTAVAETLNLAEPLTDGTKVLVPELGQAGSVAAAVSGLIDVNEADQAALESLPGIGPVTAAKIIAAREEEPFRSIDELRSRGVLGESLFADVREMLTVSR